jgi:hypothetical protein
MQQVISSTILSYIQYTKFHYFLRSLKVIYYLDIEHIKHSLLLKNTVLHKFKKNRLEAFNYSFKGTVA